MPWYEIFDREAAELLPGLEVRREEPMSRHTTFRVGGPARRMAFPGTEAELTGLLALAEAFPHTVLGNGSNVLAADGGVDLLVINTSRLEGIEPLGDTGLRAMAGTSLAKLAMEAMRRALAGLAFAHGIPGTLGGAVFMNAGAYGGEMRQVISSVRAWRNGELLTLGRSQLGFGYRTSTFAQEGGVVLSADFALEKGDEAQIFHQMEDLGSRRRSKQPLEYPSAGSTFKRPEGNFAGTLIEQCGLKGYTVGGAQVSEKHAGFVVNRGGATCADVLSVVRHVQETVESKTGVRLELEVRLLGV